MCLNNFSSGTHLKTSGGPCLNNVVLSPIWGAYSLTNTSFRFYQATNDCSDDVQKFLNN